MRCVSSEVGMRGWGVAKYKESVQLEESVRVRGWGDAKCKESVQLECWCRFPRPNATSSATPPPTPPTHTHTPPPPHTHVPATHRAALHQLPALLKALSCRNVKLGGLGIKEGARLLQHELQLHQLTIGPLQALHVAVRLNALLLQLLQLGLQRCSGGPDDCVSANRRRKRPCKPKGCTLLYNVC